jgi:Tol biopolymer transport system component
MPTTFGKWVNPEEMQSDSRAMKVLRPCQGFLPMAKTVAFTGQYDGNTDVYIVPVEGGEPKRLTWHPGADLVTGWTPDGKEVLFTSARVGVPTQESKFFKVSKDGGMEESFGYPEGSQWQDFTGWQINCLPTDRILGS